MAQSLMLGALNSGELTPLLDGRVDKPFYGSGCKLLQNMIPTVQGPVVQRSGTGFVKEVKNSANRTALIKFEFNVTQAYALEFGDQYMRVHMNHAPVTLTPTNITAITQANPGVVTANAHGLVNGDRVIVSGVLGMVEVNNREFTVAGATANTFQLSGINTTIYGAYTSGGTVAKIYEIATPYVQADLFDSEGKCRLQYAQQGDVMYITNTTNTYAPRKLTRTGHTSWTIATATFTKGPFAPANGDDTIRVLCTIPGTSYAIGDTVSVQANSAIFDANMVGMLFFMEEIYFDMGSVGAGIGSVSPWPSLTANIGGAGVMVSRDGNVYKWVAADFNASTGTSPPVHTEGDAWDGPANGGTGAQKWRYLHSRWAIVQLNSFTDTKNMSGTIVTYLCHGLAPGGVAVTGVANSADATALCRVTAAAHGYNNGDYVTISGVTGSTQANGDWKIKSVTANTFDLVGSAAPGAYTGGGTVKRFTTWKWALGAFSTSRGYPGVVAFHENRLVLAQTLAEPDSWWLSESASYDSFAPRSANQILATNAFRSTLADGQVNKIEWALSMPDGLVLGTAAAEWLLEQQQSTDAMGPNNFRCRPRSGNGSRSVQPVRVDRTGFFVQRRGKKLRDLGYDQNSRELIGTDLSLRGEHLTANYGITHIAWVQEPDALLWAIRSDGMLVGFTYQAEQQVFAWHRHVLGGYSDAGHTTAPVVEHVLSIPAPDGSQNELWLIVRRYIDGGTKRFIEYLRPRWVPSSDGYAPSVASATMAEAGLTYSGSATATVSGLWHLRGETVSVLADGRIHPPVVVDSSGRITLTYTASTIQVGLPVTAKVQTMRLETLTQTGTAQGKRKVIGEVAVRCVDVTSFQYGRNFSDLITKEFTTDLSLLDQPLPLFSGDALVDWPDDWGTETRMCLQNDQPVPFGVAAIFPQIEVTPG